MSDAIGEPDVKFYYMSLMPYTRLPENEADYASLWVDFPNRLYDPVHGHALLNRYLDEYVEADRLGFDGVVVNEHHSTAYSLKPTTNLVASALIQRTRRARICVMGSLLNVQYPNRLAEEYALLDVMAAGRFECAFPFGTGMEYWSNAAQINPATARARFREGLDLLVRAWTEDGPFSHDGEFYNYKYLNIWPRPYQRPHPKIFLVGGGSAETIDFAAQRGHGYSLVLVPKEAQDAAYTRYKKKRAEHGNPAQPDDMILTILCYVAETDPIARREYEPHVLWMFNKALRTELRYLAPPGYLSESALRRQLEAGGALYTKGPGSLEWDDIQNLRLVAGSPDTVARVVKQWLEETGAGRVIALLHAGDMPHWKTVKNMQLFAEEVIPRLRSRPAEVQS